MSTAQLAELSIEMHDHSMIPGEQHEFGESHVGDGFVIALDYGEQSAYGWIGTWETHDHAEHRVIATIADALALRAEAAAPA